MKALLLWTAIAYTQDFLTVDRLEPQPNDRVCLAITLASDIPEQEGDWQFPPDILVCHRGPVSMNRVQRAAEYWEGLGYTFGNVTQAPSDHYNCATGKVPYGTIMIDIPGQKFKMGKHLGTTKTWRSHAPYADQIFKAKIEIIPAWGSSERILEHEIGHALGWNDIRHTGHIMNGIWSLGGYGAEGLKK